MRTDMANHQSDQLNVTGQAQVISKYSLRTPVPARQQVIAYTGNNGRR